MKKVLLTAILALLGLFTSTTSNAQPPHFRPLEIINDTDCDIMVSIFAVCPSSCSTWDASFHVTIAAHSSLNYAIPGSIPWTMPPSGSCNWEWLYAQGSQACVVSGTPNSPCPYDAALVGTIVSSCVYSGVNCFEYSGPCGDCGTGTTVRMNWSTVTPGNKTLLEFF